MNILILTLLLLGLIAAPAFANMAPFDPERHPRKAAPPDASAKADPAPPEPAAPEAAPDAEDKSEQSKPDSKNEKKTEPRPKK